MKGSNHETLHTIAHTPTLAKKKKTKIKKPWRVGRKTGRLEQSQKRRKREFKRKGQTNKKWGKRVRIARLSHQDTYWYGMVPFW